MRVLVTGSSGGVGGAVVDEFEAAGHTVVPFDAKAGHDILDLDSLVAAVQGCDAVVHLAAILDETLPAADIMSVNLLGTYNALSAAQQAGIDRFVFMSSIQAFGVVQSYRDPDYLPLDDDHPLYASSPYAVAKRLSEDACETFTDTFEMTTVCLRPPTVLTAASYPEWIERRRTVPEVEDRYWNYGSWIDGRDLASATLLAATQPLAGHWRLLITADDISGNRPGLEVVADIYPGLNWFGGPEYDGDPYRTLVDCTRAKDALGWKPTRTWAEHRLSSRQAP